MWELDTMGERGVWGIGEREGESDGVMKWTGAVVGEVATKLRCFVCLGVDWNM